MNLLVQLITCFLFISTLGNILPLPLLPRNVGIVSTSRGALIHRVRRQGPIVQPSWMINSEMSLFNDFNVRVTDEKLEETEAIRDYIHETVDNGTYVVELDEGDFEEDERTADEDIPTEELSQPGPELEPEPEAELKPTTAPQPKPRPPPSPQPRPTPKENQTKAPRPAIFFKKFKIAPKRRYSALAGSPFFSWLKGSSINRE